MNNSIYNQDGLYKHTSGCPIEAKEYITFKYNFPHLAEVEILDKSISADRFTVHRIECFSNRETEYVLKHKFGGVVRVIESGLIGIGEQTPKELKLPIEFKTLELYGDITIHKVDYIRLGEHLININGKNNYDFGMVEFDRLERSFYNHRHLGRCKLIYYVGLRRFPNIKNSSVLVEVVTKEHNRINVLLENLTRIEDE